MTENEYHPSVESITKTIFVCPRCGAIAELKSTIQKNGEQTIHYFLSCGHDFYGIIQKEEETCLEKK